MLFGVLLNPGAKEKLIDFSDPEKQKSCTRGKDHF